MSENEQVNDSELPVELEAPKAKRGRKPKATVDEVTLEVEVPESDAEVEIEDIEIILPLPLAIAEPKVPVQTLFQKIAELATRSDSRSINRAVTVHKAGGTVAVTKERSLLFCPSKHPDKGGREALIRTGKVKVLIADL